MTNIPPIEPPTQQEQGVTPSSTFSTKEGRMDLYQQWCAQCYTDGTLERGKAYSKEQRTLFLADWLHWCIARHALDRHKRLPPYSELAHFFTLKDKWVVPVIQQLRDEELLPKRKLRKDKDQPQWTQRDTYFLTYVGQMRTIRFDQARRLLARMSEYDVENEMLSISRTSEILARYTAKNVHYAVSRRVFHSEPGFLYLTRRGLKHVNLDFRAEAPSIRLLSHLYWIVEVRMKLEEENSGMQWISERAIQAEQEQRRKGERLQHIPDGVLILPSANNTWTYIDIEVQISQPSREVVKNVMSDSYFSGSNDPLRYYVNKRSGSVVRSVYQQMVQERRTMRPSIEIIDLEEWLSSTTTQQ